MANEKNFYDVLGVSKTASQDEIKSAYRKLAKQYHPDVNKEPGAETKFKEAAAAYEILGDTNKRTQYDQLGHEVFTNRQQTGGGPGGPGAGGFSGFGADINDIFSQFFGGGGSRQQQQAGPRRGDDQILRMTVSFMDAIKGTTFRKSFQTSTLCPHCNGSGAQSPSDIHTCGQCRGTGRIRQTANTLFGQVQREAVCPNCGGTGKTITNKCTSCRGSGYVRANKDASITIPAGMPNGYQVKLPGFGGSGAQGGPSGDLYIEFTITKHKQFRREGNDIHIDIPIFFYDAVLGAEVVIPSVYGDGKVKIPAGSKDGDVLRLRGQGVKNVAQNRTGDQFIHLSLLLPKKLNNRQKELISDYKLQAAREDEEEYNKFLKSIQRD